MVTPHSNAVYCDSKRYCTQSVSGSVQSHGASRDAPESGEKEFRNGNERMSRAALSSRRKLGMTAPALPVLIVIASARLRLHPLALRLVLRLRRPVRGRAAATTPPVLRHVLAEAPDRRAWRGLRVLGVAQDFLHVLLVVLVVPLLLVVVGEASRSWRGLLLGRRGRRGRRGRQVELVRLVFFIRYTGRGPVIGEDVADVDPEVELLRLLRLRHGCVEFPERRIRGRQDHVLLLLLRIARRFVVRPLRARQSRQSRDHVLL